MRQMARFTQHYPLQEFVTHRFPLKDVELAMQTSMAADSMKVVIDPWA
jgi:Zn-dependent alcohol dehydrogenase